jgi:hypothetical protein
MSNGIREGGYHIFRSFKIYWAYYCWLYSEENKLKKLKDDYILCKKTPHITKMIFGKDIDLTEIKKMIEDLQNKITNKNK